MITNFIHELGAGGVSIEESGTLNKERIRRLGNYMKRLSMISPKEEPSLKGISIMEQIWNPYC